MTESVASIAAPVSSEASCLLLWTSLEASLQSSQRALLDYDLERFEVLTAEQHRLLQAIQAADRGMGETQNGAPVTGPPVGTALHSAQVRVQSLARVQQALLERAQRSLRVISNLAAGLQAPYSTVSGRPGISLRPAEATPNLFSSKEA